MSSEAHPAPLPETGRVSGDSLLSLDIKWQRLGGLALLGLSLVPLGYGTEVVAPGWRAFPTVLNTVWAANVFLVGGNMAAVGLALLFAGLGNRSVVKDRCARRAMQTRIAASNLALGSVLVAVAVTESDFINRQIDSDTAVTAVELTAYVLFAYVVRASVLLYRSSWKYETPSLDAALRSDHRPPVVYLRSFAIDDEFLTGPLLFRRLMGLWNFYATITPEQELAWIMSRIGPVVAIGRPGEHLPSLGAAKVYVDDDHWKDTVTELMSRAALIVIRAGDTANLWWEIEQAVARAPSGRVLIVALERPRRWLRFRKRFTETFGVPMPVGDPTRASFLPPWALRLLLPGNVQGAILYFDQARSCV